MKWKNIKLSGKFFITFSSVIILLGFVAITALNGINGLINNTNNIIERSDLQTDLNHKYDQHLLWSQELNKLLTDNNVTELSVETDYTKCAFGKWYYSEDRKHAEEMNPELAPLLESIEEHHIHLHESAIKIGRVFHQADAKVSSELRDVKSAHLLWMHEIKSALIEQRRNINVQKDHHLCQLGKWMGSETTKQLKKESSEFKTLVQTLEEPHQLLHESTTTIEGRLKTGNFSNAYNFYVTNTERYATQTLQLLDSIIYWNDKNLSGMHEANDIYNEETLAHLNNVGSIFENIIDNSKENISKINIGMIKDSKLTRREVIIFSLIAILIAIILASILTKGIVGPIKKGVQLADNIAQGNLNSTIDFDNQEDEIGQMVKALQTMVEKMKQIVTNVKVGAVNIASASQQMSSTSQQMSQGANEQATSAEEVSSSMEEMTSNIQQNTDNAQQTEKNALNSAEGIIKSNQSTSTSVKSMNEIAEKITIINDIAFQTNILALNAAVEAARAGEQGKGFAVVASEVRKLAERSKIAADEIVLLSGNGVKVSEEASTQLQEIMPEIDKTAKLVQEIAAASIEQNSGANQVNTAIQQLNKVTQQNAAASEELATSAEELSSQANQLLDIVGFFKLDKDTYGYKKAPNNTDIVIPSKHQRENNGIALELNIDDDTESF